MRETAEDLRWLQGVLDSTYASAGAHLAEIHSTAARLSAVELVGRLEGMQILVVATVTRDGRPLTGPVDAFLYRGRWHFGTSPSAVRARHLARSPHISATHVRGEALVVTVHGRARRVDLQREEADFAALLREHYGAGWDEWGRDSPYYAIAPHRMLAADMSVHAAAS